MIIQLNYVNKLSERSSQGESGMNVTEEDKGVEGGSIHEFGSLVNKGALCQPMYHVCYICGICLINTA